MPKLLSKVRRVRVSLSKRKAAWWTRLVPANPKDTWRGLLPRKVGLMGERYSSMGGLSFFILRKVASRPTSTRYTYLLLLAWRQSWLVLVPLTPNTLSPNPGVRLSPFFEKALLSERAFCLNPRLSYLWTTLLRGLGGVSRLKVRFKGKSYKWHRRKGAILLRFGHSHLVAVSPYPGVRWRRFGRMKIIFYGSSWWDLLEFAKAVCWWRPTNVYHGRGIRLRRQAILRKSGKVSAYR